MPEPFIGEIRMFGGSFAPAGWSFCDGQLVPISQNDALFVLLGTAFGGDGEETFGLPNLQSRAPMHNGNGFTLGEAAGVEEVTLTTSQIPVHTHALLATSNTATDSLPTNNVLAQSKTAGIFMYLEDTPTVNLAPTSITPIGGSQPHTNLQPYLCISFIISLFGVFPRQG
jgi:microcystin-dependent protein